MKDHSSGCTFGGCASYAMAGQANWSSSLFGAGLGLYTSNEWPSGSDYGDVGSLSDLKNKIDSYIGHQSSLRALVIFLSFYHWTQTTGSLDYGGRSGWGTDVGAFTTCWSHSTAIHTCSLQRT